MNVASSARICQGFLSVRCAALVAPPSITDPPTADRRLVAAAKTTHYQHDQWPALPFARRRQIQGQTLFFPNGVINRPFLCFSLPPPSRPAKYRRRQPNT